MRDIESYSEKYSVGGFEEWKVFYRRRKLLEIIEAYRPKKILEIGCGYEPLFQYVQNAEFTVVEASTEFYENAVKLSENSAKKVKIIRGFFEDVVQGGELSTDYDMIICASLLHEVEHPKALLEAIVSVCNSDTVVNIIVPNANSMHRLLGKAMGILADVHDMSESNVSFQQNTVFDKNSLTKMVTDCGFEVVEDGAFFVKPFSHKQMHEMVRGGILNREVLDGLYILGDYMAEYASELYVNCRIKDGGINDR